MIKLIIFFRKPTDVQAFEEHFAHRHVPLIAAMPKVMRTSVVRALGAPRGEPPYYLIHEIYFADMASLNYALNSAQGRAAGADLMAFARDIVSLMFAEVWGEDLTAAAPSAGSASEFAHAPETAALPHTHPESAPRISASAEMEQGEGPSEDKSLPSQTTTDEATPQATTAQSQTTLP